MRIKAPEKAYSFSPKENDTIRLVRDLGFPIRFNVVFERGGYTYTTAKALVVDGDKLTLWEQGKKTEGSLCKLYYHLYWQLGRGIRLVPVPV